MSAPLDTPMLGARLQRAFATATTCAFAAVPCIALGFAAPALGFAAVAGAAAVVGWTGLGRLTAQEQAFERLTAERDRLFGSSEAQALRAEAAEVRLRRMGERVRELYFEFDNESRRFVYLSPVFEKLFGIQPGTAYADSATVFERFDEARQVTLNQALTEGTADERVRLEFKTAEGLLRRASLTTEVDAGDARLVRGTLTLLRVGTGLSLPTPGDDPTGDGELRQAA